MNDRKREKIIKNCELPIIFIPLRLNFIIIKYAISLFYQFPLE